MERRSLIRILHVLTLFALGALAACATFQVNTIPPPPATSKLRVFVQPFSGPGRWGVSHEAFVANQVRRVEQYLEKTGIYEVVSAGDVQAALGGQSIARYRMERNGWQLAREAGRALHADYILVIERSQERGAEGSSDFAFLCDLINTETGKTFASRTGAHSTTKADNKQLAALIRDTYREIFNSAKQDMLARAVAKEELRARPPAPAYAPEQKPEIPPAAQHPPATGSAAQDRPEKQASTQADALANGTRLVVYDFDAADQYRTVALILAEALREELFRLNRFTLVNRETLQQVLQEMALQQTGLIDEKQAVTTGKGLSARQIVTGRLAVLGKTFVLQTKRIDVETFATLGLTSVKFAQGQEDEVLEKLPGMARSLVGM
jgi:curli biogenesis system outer membrane secretion channel CsgG